MPEFVMLGKKAIGALYDLHEFAMKTVFLTRVVCSNNVMLNFHDKIPFLH